MFSRVKGPKSQRKQVQIALEKSMYSSRKAYILLRIYFLFFAVSFNISHKLLLNSTLQ